MTLPEGVTGSGILTALGLLCGIWILARVVTQAVQQRADLDYWQIVASRGLDGKQFLDAKKIGYLLGCFGGFWLCVRLTYNKDGLPFEIFAAWLAFLAGIDVFTTLVRGKYGIKSDPSPDDTQPHNTGDPKL